MLHSNMLTIPHGLPTKLSKQFEINSIYYSEKSDFQNASKIGDYVQNFAASVGKLDKFAGSSCINLFIFLIFFFSV